MQGPRSRRGRRVRHCRSWRRGPRHRRPTAPSLPAVPGARAGAKVADIGPADAGRHRHRHAGVCAVLAECPRLPRHRSGTRRDASAATAAPGGGVRGCISSGGGARCRCRVGFARRLRRAVLERGAGRFRSPRRRGQQRAQRQIERDQQASHQQHDEDHEGPGRREEVARAWMSAAGRSGHRPVGSPSMGLVTGRAGGGRGTRRRPCRCRAASEPHGAPGCLPGPPLHVPARQEQHEGQQPPAGAEERAGDAQPPVGEDSPPLAASGRSA